MEKESKNLRKSIYRYSVMINNYFKELITAEMIEAGKKLELCGSMKFSYYFILCELYHSNKPLSLTQLASLVSVKLPNISNLVNELIKIGLVEQCQYDTNKRKVTVQLLELGIKYSNLLLPELSKIGKYVYGSDAECEKIYEYYSMLHARHFGKREDR